ncbi:hypothetical protein K151_677 [Proteus hauseri ZMd44]|nr:hypothetical protein K151_677 [Proteus hauseri ZMd44]
MSNTPRDVLAKRQESVEGGALGKSAEKHQ